MAAEPINLLSNPGYEEAAGADGVPPGWRTYVPRAGAVIGTTETLPKEGRRSAFVENTTDIIGLLVNDPPTDIAPGERLRMSVWGRTEDVGSDTGGGLTFTAGFVANTGRMVSWNRANLTADNSGKWTEFSQTVTAPEGATFMTFQVGLRRAHGRTWWDAARLEPEFPIALRLEPPSWGAGVGDTSVPAVLLNRLPKSNSVDIVTQPGGAAIRVRLTGETTQPVQLPYKIAQRGKVLLKASVQIVDDSAKADRSIRATNQVPAFTTSQTVTVADAISIEPLIPTHWAIEDGGQPHFLAEYRLNVEAAQMAGSMVQCTVRNANSAVVARTTATLAGNPAQVFVALPKNSPTGDYTVQLDLLQKGRSVASAKEMWHIIHRSECSTQVSPDGYPLVQGKKFFPIAMYMGDPEHFDELKKAGFNVTQSYPAFAGPESSNRTVEQFLDKAQAAGLKTLTFVSHGQDRLNDEASLKRIRTFKNHPATLVWYQEEVLARGYKPISWLANLVGMLRREAPEHPILEGDQRDESSRMVGKTRWFPDEYMDFGTWWWYPTPLREKPSMENYEGDPGGPQKEYKPPKFLTDNGTTKPIWMAIQCYKKPGQSDSRFPTPAEYRCHAYLSICHGAKGLLYYTGMGENGTGVLMNKKEGHWDYLKKLAGELREMSPVFMSPDAAKWAEVLTTGALVSTRMKQTEYGRVLICVNRAITPLDFRVRVPDATGTARVKYENRKIDVKEGRLADHFDSYAVHIYELN